MSSIGLKISKILNDLATKYSEYGPIVDKIRLVIDNRPDTTMWVNPHLEMGYCEKYCSKLKSEQLAAVVLHEVRHIENGHFARMDNLKKIVGTKYEHIVHNIAADLEINCKIPNLPTDLYLPKSLGYPDNLTYEEYFQKLINDPKCPGGIPGSGSKSSNDLSVNHSNSSGNTRNCTSSDTNLSEEDKSFISDIEEEIQEVRESRGTGQGTQTSKLKLNQSPAIDVMKYIRVFLSNFKEKKMFGYDFINYNSFKNTTIPNIIDFKTYTPVFTVKLSFIIDVSGSRTNKQINESVSRIWSTLESADDIDFIVDLYFADDDVTQVNRVTCKEEIPQTFKGRGGTYLSKAFKKFKEPYDLIIVLTDGYIDWPDINNLDKSFLDKTILGIDKQSYLRTRHQTKLPTFIL